MTASDQPGDRLAAFGNQLVEVHLQLREELDRIREDLDSHLDGGERPRTLWAHCMTFCSALTRHHTGEDGGAFPVLAERFPELRPVIEQLEHDHLMVTGILSRVEELLGGLTPRTGMTGMTDTEDADDTAGARAVRDELDGLSAILESHFRYEEKKIVEALNSLDLPEWKGSPPAFLRVRGD
ncbi:hemerythrin domain-containing protein [Streptosporangium sp. NPDC004379]|uniref:hemerythrin domain-containing protein n=1 Tax=Streptosporangium sp. NPDC004379 TaxID=3366189 RepID=UPI0036AA82FE